MKYEQSLKKIGKNLLAALIGAFFGVIISTIYLFKIWLPLNVGKVGLGIIALIPVVLILFAIFGIFVGGVCGIFVYHTFRFLSKNK